MDWRIILPLGLLLLVTHGVSTAPSRADERTAQVIAANQARASCDHYVDYNNVRVIDNPQKCNQQPLQPEELYKNTLRSVAYVKALKPGGSGFAKTGTAVAMYVFNDLGGWGLKEQMQHDYVYDNKQVVFLTNCHVVEWQSESINGESLDTPFDIDSAKITLDNYDERSPDYDGTSINRISVEAKVIEKHCNLDLAFLSIELPLWDADYFKTAGGVRSFDSIAPGNKVFAIGNPAGLRFSFSRGIVSQKRVMDLSKLMENVCVVQFDAAISPGSSGGGLVDEYGNLIGITESSLTANGNENLNFAISPVQIWELLPPGVIPGVTANRGTGC
jgi:S1-C subfamily serine protease